MQIKSRDLPPYSEPVAGTALRPGNVYFAVNYVDDEMTIPMMEALVFIGSDLEAGDSGLVYFQDIGSYRSGHRYPLSSLDSDASIHVSPRTNLNHIFEYGKALDELIRCGNRRNQAHVD